MVWLASHYLNLEQQDLFVVVLWLYLTSSLSNYLTALLVSSLMSWFFFLFQSNDLLPPLHVAYCWDIIRTTCYQELTIVTCWVKSWWRCFSTRGYSSLWLTRKRLPIFTYLWWHMPITLSITSFKIFNMSRLMGVMSIERNETCVEASSSDHPVADHVEISWTPVSVLCVWCFNGNINPS